MIIALLLFIIPTFFATLVVTRFEVVKEKVLALLLGTIFGIVGITSITYGLTLWTPLSQRLLTSELFILALGSVWLLYMGTWQTFKTLSFNRRAAQVFFASLILFSLIAPKLLLVRPDGLSTGIINAFGDIAWHMSTITMFAEGQSHPPENPIFADTRLVYPFMSNFFSSLLLVGGASFSMSVVLPAILLLPILTTLFYYFVFTYTDRQKAAIIALLLFVFGGATFGFTRFVKDYETSNRPLFEFLYRLPDADYSGVGTDKNGFHFLNPTTTLLLPQRSFLFGMPLAFAILILLHPSLPNRDKRFMAAGILAGLLPLSHAHTILALIPAIIGLFFLNRGMHWFLFFLTAGIVGMPELVPFLQGGQASGSFFRYEPRWMAGEMNLIWYWFQNTGLLIPLSLLGVFSQAPKTVKAFSLAGLLLLVVSNIFLFAPWAWDNFKLIVFWLILSLPLIGWLATEAIRKIPYRYVTAVVVVLVGFHMVSAVLDFWKLSLPTAAIWSEWSNEDITFAEEIKRVTQPRENILTAPIHNSPVFLAGRPVYLGYAAHVWSHGHIPWDREKAIADFYQGEIDKLPETTVQYVFVGPVERSKYPDMKIRDNWQIVAEQEGYTLYKL